MKILEKIDKLRIEKNWTFYKLAEECDLPLSTISNLYVRKSLPSLNTLTAICKGLGVTLSQFFAENEIDIQFEQERELLNVFRKLDANNQNIAIQILKLLPTSQSTALKNIV
ncbi:MAG: helix-turn-helix transcriptional regulator [Clostridiales bacterium]|nr:helix-turn-helix transcriptional regulator [Clostridiales bacterium]